MQFINTLAVMHKLAGVKHMENMWRQRLGVGGDVCNPVIVSPTAGDCPVLCLARCFVIE